MVGAILALLVALAYGLGLPMAREMEAKAGDFLFLHGRPNPPAPSDRIVHVDIDDSSLDTISRWPWPRKLLAESIAAIDRFGARVIAIDILLSEPQEPQFTEEGGVIDHDLELERAFRAAKAKVILAVSLESARTQLGPLWQGSEGNDRWRAVVGYLSGHITADADDVIRMLGLDSDRAERVRNRLREMKRIAIREVAARLAAEGRLDLPRLTEEMVGSGADRLGNFPELTLMKSEYETYRAAQRFESLLPPAPPESRLPVADSIIAPIPRFAEAVDGAGFVNVEPDSDGHVRRVHVRWTKSGRVYLQLGLAAAAAYRGLAPETLSFSPALVEAGGRHVLLDNEEMLFSWPRIDAARRWQHIPLGRVLEISWREDELEELRARAQTLARELVRVFLDADGFVPGDLDDPQRAPEVIEALHDQVAFMLQAEPEPTGDPEQDEAMRRTFRTAREWQESTLELTRGTREIAAAAQGLRTALADRIVFVGWNAAGNFGDFYPTVLDERTPGVVAHAIVANAFLTGYQVLPGPIWLGAGLAFLLGLLAAVLTSLTGTRFSFLLALLLAIVYTTVDTLLVFSSMRMSLAIVTPLGAIALAWTGTTAARAVHERREKAQLQRQFGARISPQLFDFLIQNPELVSLEGQEREVACFFSDLAGFTSISESLDSRTTVSILNRYMWEMNDELTKYQAYVNKFLGDGIMAVWGAFETGTPHAERACRAALGCFQRLETMLTRPEFENLPPLSMRIGIATGIVTVGDCGAPPDLRDYTVIGDSANLAARLESANKQFGTRVLMNGRTKELIPDEIVTRPLGMVAVVGQQTATEIHEIVALRGQETALQRTLINLTEQAVAAFAERRLEEARTLWRRIVEEHGHSPLTALYLAEIERALAAGEAPFDGVLRLTAK